MSKTSYLFSSLASDDWQILTVIIFILLLFFIFCKAWTHSRLAAILSSCAAWCVCETAVMAKAEDCCSDWQAWALAFRSISLLWYRHAASQWNPAIVQHSLIRPLLPVSYFLHVSSPSLNHVGRHSTGPLCTSVLLCCHPSSPWLPSELRIFFMFWLWEYKAHAELFSPAHQDDMW